MKDVVCRLNEALVLAGGNAHDEIKFEYRTQSYIDQIYFMGICVYNSDYDALDSFEDTENEPDYVYAVALSKALSLSTDAYKLTSKLHRLMS